MTAIEDDTERTADEFVAYLRTMAAPLPPRPGGDLLVHLVTVRDSDGDQLTEDELVTTCVLLLNAPARSPSTSPARSERPDRLQRRRSVAGRDRAVVALPLE